MEQNASSHADSSSDRQKKISPYFMEREGPTKSRQFIKIQSNSILIL